MGRMAEAQAAALWSDQKKWSAAQKRVALQKKDDGRTWQLLLYDKKDGEFQA